MLLQYQQQLRERYLAAPVVAAPDPWRLATHPHPCIAVGGLIGVGFAVDTASGNDLLMIVSHNGRGLVDTHTGQLIARDHDVDPDVCMPSGPDLCCPGIGALGGSRIRIAGLFGGGLHTTTGDGWTLDVVAPEWPNERVLLSFGGRYDGPPGQTWWNIFDCDITELRAAGFSSSGRTLVIATSGDVTVLTRQAISD